MLWKRLFRPSIRRVCQSRRRLFAESLEARQLLSVSPAQIESLDIEFSDAVPQYSVADYDMRSPQSALSLVAIPNLDFTFDSNERQIASIGSAAANPVVASDLEGNHVVIRQQRTSDRFGWDLFGQRYDSEGKQVGSGFRVNEQRLGDQTNPQVAMSPTGEFTVVFENTPESRSSDIDVMSRTYDANGEPISTQEVVVNSDQRLLQFSPDVDYLDSEKFVVVWAEVNDFVVARDNEGVSAQLMTGDDLIGAPIRVNIETAGAQNAPAVDAVEGGFTVAWRAHENTTSASLRSFSVGSNGELTRTREVQIEPISGATDSSSIDWKVDVAVDAESKNVVVVWQHVDGESFDHDVYAQMLRPNLTSLVDPFAINQTLGGDQMRPTAALIGDDLFIAWEGVGAEDDHGIYARQFDLSGQPNGDEILVNSRRIDGIQTQPNIVSSDNGIEIVWAGMAENGRNGVFRRSFRTEADNIAPTIAELRDAVTVVDESYTFDLEVSDPDDVPFVRVFANNGAVVTQDETNLSRYTVTPPLGFEGRLNVVATANDRVNGIVRERFTLQVADQRPPGILLNDEFAESYSFTSETLEYSIDLTVLDVDTELAEQRVTRIVTSDAGRVRIQDNSTILVTPGIETSSDSPVVTFTLIVFDGTHRVRRDVEVLFDTTTLLVGSPSLVSLPASDTVSGDLGYTVTSSNPDVSATIMQGNRSIRFSVTDFGSMVFELFEDRAPLAAERMIQLAESGFYEGITFHRVINDFVIQAGDPLGTGTGGSTLGDFDDQFDFDLQHNRTGLLSMAKSGDDTNDSQFFVTEGPSRHLDFNHTIFGVLTEGEAVREAISNVSTGGGNRPVPAVIIESAEVFVDERNAVLLLKANEGATGSSTISVTATDGNGATFQQAFDVVLENDSSNGGPILVPFDDQLETPINTQIEFDLEALDVEGDDVFFAVGQASSGQVEIDGDTGLVTFIPETDFQGEVSFAVGVRAADGEPSDTNDTFDSQEVTILVGP